ncbi:fibronectin type III domain-containing protein [Halochromatium salexigens]|uniref:Fibronectin type-III domain-containing protein n=1 Tax=Halochromatium salexigens TaxID=49447 RepID=A0AAJ0UID8_HALSE|nr:fibronectin type III domain-containing protein [Halochromatium salexigens]MBK5932066.1 hypothetical protein [Halochromatium salexigens]
MRLIFIFTLLLAPLHTAIGATDAQLRHIDDDAQQILVEDHVSLLVLPEQDYGELEIILQGDNARIAEISLSLAANAHFLLPDHDYRYSFNSDTARVEIFNDAELRVLALPVDAEGLTPWVRVGEREETRIAVDAFTLTLIEATLPSEQAAVAFGQAPEQIELVEASSLKPDEIALSWLATSDNDTPASQIRYLLHAATDSGFIPDGSTVYAEVMGAGSGTISETITGLLPDTRYYVKVEAVDAAGHRSSTVRGVTLCFP